MIDSTGIVYYVVLGFSAFVAFISDKAKSQMLSYYFAIISFLPIYLLCALRYNVGSDYIAYQDIFYNIKYGYGSYVEPLYYSLNYLFSAFKNGWLGVFAISAFITFTPLFYIGCKEKILFWVVLLIFASGFLFRANNLIRQGIATAFFLLAIYWLHRGNNKKFYINIIVATLFHYTSIVFIASSLLRQKIKVHKNIYVLLATVLLIASFFINATDIIKRIISLVPYYGEIYSIKLIDQSAGNGTNIVVYFWALISIIMFYIRPNNIMALLFMIGSVSSLYFLQLSLAFRFLSYLTDIKILLIGLYLKDFRVIKGYYAFTFVFVLMMLCLVFVNITNGISGSLPYRAFLSI